MSITTPLTQLFGIEHPIMLAGMSVAAGPELAAAVTNAGGLGVIGGLHYTPEFLVKQIKTLKSFLKDKNAPFGVDLLIPKVGGNARKTNYDYTEGKLPELIDIVIAEKAKLFVCAVGVPPKWVVDKLHAAGIPIMNMIGAPKHVRYALDAGCDIICAQGGEAGGHTGDLATSLLIPAVVELCANAKSPLTGGPVYVVAAGGIYSGRGLAAALAYGAQAVWVGTRFVCAKEAGAPPYHQQSIIKAGYHDTVRTLVYSGRPMRVMRTEYIDNWENERLSELKELTAQGVIPVKHDIENKNVSDQQYIKFRPLIMGQAAGAITSIKPAAEIVSEMMAEAVAAIKHSATLLSSARAKL